MSTLGSTVMTLKDWAKTLDPNGQPARIIENLSLKNEILDDWMFKEGNLPIGERTTIRTGLASAYFRLLNQGTAPSKSTTAQVDESCAILESVSQVDVEVARLGGNPAAVRLNEGNAHLQAMMNTMATTLFYGNSSTSPEQFNGLSVRYSSLSAANGRNIIAGGGSGNDNTSIWLVGWGDQSVMGIFPKGSTAGIQHKDYGETLVPITTGAGATLMPAYQDLWQWKAGLVVKDWRFAVRIANIDVSVLVANSSPADLTLLMTKAVHHIESVSGVRAAFYCNRTVAQYLDIQRQTKVQAGGQLSYEVVDGRNTMSFRGIPIRRCDALLETEATVS